jgi:alpha-L-fucosidase
MTTSNRTRTVWSPAAGIRMINMIPMWIALCLTSFVATGTASAEDSSGVQLPRVLLIGDSICGGYQRGVKKLLAGKALVVKNKGNAQHTRTGLDKLDEWLGDGKWDVIHFNWGLWDVAYRNPKSQNFGHLDKVDGKLTTSLSDYEKNLRKLVAGLKATGAALIWASTTPVPEGEPGRIKGDEVRYNAVAAKIMVENGIIIDDLHAEVIRQGRPKTNNVHDTGDLSGKVAESIVAALAGREAPANPGKESVKQLQEDFRKLQFGMFIHYNMATYKGVQWVSGYPDPSTFDPGGKVDTDAWADAAKAAGMKYAVLTTKHVGGFCLWDSKYTTYDIMHPDCPYKQDLAAQFVKSFKSRGLKVGFYYCWRHPGFDAGKNKGKYKVLPPECDPATHSVAEQIEFQKKQVAELLENYPDVFYIWNDALDPEIMPAEKASKFLKGVRPDVVASGNWWDWKKKGLPYLDIVVSETRHLGTRHMNNKTTGETCWCLERKWFYTGSGPKKAEDIVAQIEKANSRNANFLLNVGPDKQGKIAEASVKALAEIGKLWKPSNTILAK